MNPLLDLLGALGVVGVVLGWGWGLERALGLQSLRPALGWLGPICLGTAHWVLLVFLLAAVGELAVLPVAIATVVSGTGVLLCARRHRAPSQSAPALPRPGLLVLACLLALGAVLASLLCNALSPSISWDADTYHLGVPRLYLAHGGFRALPFNAYSNWPLATEMLFTLAMLVRGFVSAKLVHFAAGIAVLHGMWVAIRSQPGAREMPWVAVLLPTALLLANEVVIEEFPIAYVDLAHGFFLLAATLFISHAIDNPHVRTPCLWLAGVAGGLLASVKVSGVVGTCLVFGLGLPAMIALLRKRGLVSVLREWGLPLGLPVLVLWGPWLLKSEMLVSNPIYPLFYSVLGGQWWSASLSEQFTSWMSSMGMGRNWVDFLWLPQRVIFEGGAGYENFDQALFAGWGLVLPLGVWACSSNRMARRCMALGVAFFVFWAASSQQMRLLVPALPLFAVACSLGVLKSRSIRGGPVFALVVLVVMVDATIWTARGRVHMVSQVIGELGNPGEAETQIPPVYRFIRQELPADARLLLLNTNHCFFCERDYVADSFFEASQLAWWFSQAQDTDELIEQLESLGLTHVLWASRDWGIAYPERLLRLLEDPGRVEVVYSPPGGSPKVLALR